MRRINCAQIEPSLEAYVDHELEPWMVAVVQAHLGECSKCAGVVRELRAINKAVADWALSALPAEQPGETQTLTELLRSQLPVAVSQPARSTPLNWVSSGLKRTGITPQAASRALVAGAVWSGRVVWRGARLAATSMITPAPHTPTKKSEDPRRASLSARAAVAVGRGMTRAAVAGAKWVGREALALG